MTHQRPIGGIDDGVHGHQGDSPTLSSRHCQDEPARSPNPEPEAPRPRVYSAHIDQLLRDISVDFHDVRHTRSNCTQARTLWPASGLGETDFVQILYSACAIVLKRGNIQKQATDSALPGLNGLKNKMPYFFSVVRNELRSLRAAPQATQVDRQ